MIRCVLYGALGMCAALSSSCSKSGQAYENVTATPEEHPPHEFKGQVSYYDTVAPAVLHTDELHLYDTFASLMRFSDKMPRDNSTRGLSANFTVDTAGVMQQTERMHATERKEEFESVYNYLLKQMSWTPAHLKRDTTIKEPFVVWLVIHVDKDSVELDMRGGARYLYKRYARPMAH